MRLAHRPAYSAAPPAGRGATAPDTGLPVEIAFLSGRVDRALLVAATRTARRDRVCAARTLIATGGVSASFYYRELARRLGVRFEDGWPQLEPDVDIATALRTARLPVVGRGSARWLAAPQGAELRALIEGRLSYLEPARIAITTPAHLAAVLLYRAQPAIEKIATCQLPDTAPNLSARGATDAWTWSVVAVAAVYLGVGATLLPHVFGVVFGMLFLISMVFRLLVAAAVSVRFATPHRTLSDAELPTYTVLVPLHGEADIFPDLLAALNALDYPRAKLEVLVLIEPEDEATRAALAAAVLPPWLQVVFAPRIADLRTKPRALNIGLLMASGELVTVFDAEDHPQPDQLRLAAAAFEAMPDVACLQARLAIDGGGSWLSRMFAVEYAALFDVLNIGTTTLRLPLALGGTSNHFRISVLRAAGGWDAWNVTEDADLGLRLARLGHRIDSLDATTWERAPQTAPVWMKQRRRWMKGWLQTSLVLARDARSLLASFGLFRTLAVALMLVSMVLGPLGLPVFAGAVLYHAAIHGLPTIDSLASIVEATLASAVATLGFASLFWSALVGLRVRGLLSLLPSLPLLLPYQLMVSAAAFLGLWDLMRRPHHWHKTPHPRHANEC